MCSNESEEKPKRRRAKIRVHPNKHVISKNLREGTRDPVVSVKWRDQNLYAHEVEFHGPSRLVYRPDRPLSCGARMWVETYGPVVLIQDGGKERKLPDD